MSRTNVSGDILSRMRAFENTIIIPTTDSSGTGTTRTTTTSIITNSANACRSSSTSIAASESERTATEQRRLERSGCVAATTMMMSSPPPGVQTDADGLILPKKLINPCLESTTRKQLHRELKFNNRMGKSVLNQKSELQRAYEKQREKQQQQQQIQEQHSPTLDLKGELSRVIMERAQKHERSRQGDSADGADDEDRQYMNPEYLNARAKLRTGQQGELK